MKYTEKEMARKNIVAWLSLVLSHADQVKASNDDIQFAQKAAEFLDSKEIKSIATDQILAAYVLYQKLRDERKSDPAMKAIETFG